MDLSNVKIVKQADFSEGYAPALAEDKNYYIVGEDGSVTPTKYHSIGSIPNEVSFSGFDNGVCLVLSEDHQVNYQLPTLHHTTG